MGRFILLILLCVCMSLKLNRCTTMFNCHLPKCHFAQLEDNRATFTIQLPDYLGHLYHFNFPSNSVEDKSQTGPPLGFTHTVCNKWIYINGYYVCRWLCSCVYVYEVSSFHGLPNIRWRVNSEHPGGLLQPSH